MIRAIGYAGICLGLPERSITRTARLANATPERLRALIDLNLTDLYAILAYNLQHHLCLFRINQSIIPYASHTVNVLPWWEDEAFGPLLRKNGAFIQAHGLRVSMHPGQYTVLNSENPLVVEAAMAELTATCRVLDVMGLSPAHKIVIHGGSSKPDRQTALARLASNWAYLPAQVRARLVLENDDKIFSVDDLLPIATDFGVPLVFDWLHHARPGTWAGRPVSAIMRDVVATWRATDGPPKVHFSSQDPEKRPGAHAYWLNTGEFRTFAEQLAEYSVDVMLECKGKDLAAIRLLEELHWTMPSCGAVCNGLYPAA